MTRRSAQRVAFYHRPSADEPEPASLAAQQAALSSYLADHPEWELIPAFDIDQRQPVDRPETTGQPLLASPPHATQPTDRPDRIHRRP
jgi:hypothetical protein